MYLLSQIYYGRDGFFRGFENELPREFTGGDGMWAIAALLILVAGIVAVISAVQLAMYILRSIGLYRLAANRGMSAPGLAWIPLVGQYRIGSIADDIAERNGSQSYFRYILLIGMIISNTVSSVFNIYFLSSLVEWTRDAFSRRGSPVGDFVMYSGLSHVLGLIGFAAFVVTIIALNRLYQTYRPQSATTWTVVSVILPFMWSIFLFIMRNDVPQAQAVAERYQPVHNPQGPPPAYPPYPPVQGGYYPPATYNAHPVYHEGAQNAAQMPYQPPRAPEPPQTGEIQSLIDELNPTGQPEPPPEPPVVSEQANTPPASWGVNDNPQNGR